MKFSDILTEAKNVFVDDNPATWSVDTRATSFAKSSGLGPIIAIGAESNSSPTMHFYEAMDTRAVKLRPGERLMTYVTSVTAAGKFSPHIIVNFNNASVRHLTQEGADEDKLEFESKSTKLNHLRIHKFNAEKAGLL